MNAALGLRAALMLLVLIAIAPVFAVVVQASLAEQEARLERARSNLRATVELAAVHQEGLVEGVRQLLTAIAHAPPVQGPDRQACADYLRRLQDAYPDSYGTFGMLDPQGGLTCRSSPPPPGVRSDDRAFFQGAVSSGRFTVGEYTRSRASGREILTFGLPVFAPGDRTQLRGVAYAAVDVNQMARVLERLATVPEFSLSVLDHDGRVLAAAGPSPLATGSMVPAGFAVEGSAELLGVARSVGQEGERKLLVVGTASRAAVLAPLERRLQGQLAALTLITLAGLALAWLFAGRVLLGPMRQLLSRVDALAQEQQRLDRAPDAVPIREFDELNRRFHEMARSLAERAVQRDGALAEMAHQKNLLDSVLQGMAEGVIVIDRAGRFVHVNAAAQAILPGLAAMMRSGRTTLAQVAPGNLFQLDGHTPLDPTRLPGHEALGGSKVESFRYVVHGALSGGRRLVVRGGARPIAIPEEDPRGVAIVFADVTEEHAAQERLQNSERRYRTLFESNPHPMWVFDTLTLRFLTVNDAAIAHYGYSREEFLGMTLADIRPQEDVATLEQALGNLDVPLSSPRVWRHRVRDGRIILVEISSHALEYEGRQARMVLAHDVTARVHAEEGLRNLNETLEGRVYERTRDLAIANEELESFSYSVSHDLRAPLQVIDGFGRALATRHAERLDVQARHYLERIRDNTRQMGQLIDDLLALARVTRTQIQVEPFDLSVRAAQVAETLRQRHPERDVEVDIQSPMPCVGDPRLLGIVLNNLIGNAWKFTGRAAHPRIRVGCREGKVTEYFVEDNGAGFDMAYADKLFKAFQRLHPVAEFEGTGIGLATVHRIVSRHGGRVWAEARPGEGAVFRFTLQEGSP
jgi:PAS domain S-box-containing protein